MKKAKKAWKYDSYLKSAIRKIWRWSANRRVCLKALTCNKCGTKRKKLFADHVQPVVDPVRGFVSWDDYVTRMFNGELQALCEKCHKDKTKVESLQRQKARKARKLNESA